MFLCNYQFHLQVENYCINWLGTLQGDCQRQRNPLTIHFSYAHSNLSELNLLTDLNLSVLRSTPSVHVQSSERAKLLCRFQEIKTTVSPLLPIPISAPNFHHTRAKCEAKCWLQLDSEDSCRPIWHVNSYSEHSTSVPIFENLNNKSNTLQFIPNLNKHLTGWGMYSHPSSEYLQVQLYST